MLISYTTYNGDVKKGILMPESWKSPEMGGNSSTIVPLIKALPIIKELKADQKIKTDNGITILKNSYDYSILIASLNVQRFDFFIKNEKVLQYISYSGGFFRTSSAWKREVDYYDIGEVVEAIYKYCNCLVSLDAQQIEQIKNSFITEKIEDKVFPKLVELEVKLFNTHFRVSHLKKQSYFRIWYNR